MEIRLHPVHVLDQKSAGYDMHTIRMNGELQIPIHTPPPPPPPPSLSLYSHNTQCQTPYVGNGVYCALDEDGDSFPSIVPDPICDINSTQSYCFQDVCPNVPNTSPTDDSPCNGLSGEGAVT